MEEFRKKIDKCDLEIINSLKKRMEISREIGIYKNNNNLTIFNKEREKILIEKLKNLSNEFLTKEAIEKIYKEILNHSKQIQKI